jgi:hypothetical protein
VRFQLRLGEIPAARENAADDYVRVDVRAVTGREL